MKIVPWRLAVEDYATAAHWECASWHYVLRARNGNLRNGNARNGNERNGNLRIGSGVSYVMSLPYGDGEPREGGGLERLGLSICVGRLDIIACLCTRY